MPDGSRSALREPPPVRPTGGTFDRGESGVRVPCGLSWDQDPRPEPRGLPRGRRVADGVRKLAPGWNPHYDREGFNSSRVASARHDASGLSHPR